jgi:hypothetical protein
LKKREREKNRIFDFLVVLTKRIKKRSQIEKNGRESEKRGEKGHLFSDIWR